VARYRISAMYGDGVPDWLTDSPLRSRDPEFPSHAATGTWLTAFGVSRNPDRRYAPWPAPHRRGAANPADVPRRGVRVDQRRSATATRGATDPLGSHRAKWARPRRLLGASPPRSTPPMRTTFTARSRPLLATPGVEYIGELCEADKPAFYAGAAATLFPSEWPEPFGLVLIEPLAAATPRCCPSPRGRSQNHRARGQRQHLHRRRRVRHMRRTSGQTRSC
jgi:Glycosyl transferases group 1